MVMNKHSLALKYLKGRKMCHRRGPSIERRGKELEPQRVWSQEDPPGLKLG